VGGASSNVEKIVMASSKLSYKSLLPPGLKLFLDEKVTQLCNYSPVLQATEYIY